MTAAFQANAFQNDAFQINGVSTVGLRFNSSLNGLSVSGPFFADRIAIDREEREVSRFKGFVARDLLLGLSYEA